MVDDPKLNPARCHICLTILDADGSCRECRANPKLRVGVCCEECSGPLYGTGRARFCSDRCMRKSQNRRHRANLAEKNGVARVDPVAAERARCIEIILACEPTAGPADIIRAIEEGAK